MHFYVIRATIFIIRWFNGSMVYIIHLSQKSYIYKYNLKHMKEQLLDEDPAKREACSQESSALIYTTSTSFKTYTSKR